MAGLDPAIHVFPRAVETWIPGTSPGMTNFCGSDIRPRSVLLALEMADVFLRVELKPDPVDQVELGLEKIDMLFLVLHQAFEQIA
jgi:hypothetical protein